MSASDFGIYFHIPYCLQKCHYCDFVTAAIDQPNYPKPPEYVQLLINEIDARAPLIKSALVRARNNLTSVYFGGGTPSLLPAQAILTLLNKIATLGLAHTADIEVTIEINPGTVDAAKLDLYLASGVNRFSVGAQTFRDDFLFSCGRKHNANDTRKTLRLFAERKLNYSFDLLFGLPGQTISDLKEDLGELAHFSPPHVSLYNLTLPKNHPMNKGRASDEEQASMFTVIERELNKCGLQRYEISNFSKPGFESRHNHLYWSGAPYWGLGVGAHSYFPSLNEFGVRISNPAAALTWQQQIDMPFFDGLPASQIEKLRLHEALTDFFHTRLRRTKGFSWSDLTKWLKTQNTSNELMSRILKNSRFRAQNLTKKGLLTSYKERLYISQNAYAVSNLIFLEFTFLADDFTACSARPL